MADILSMHQHQPAFRPKLVIPVVVSLESLKSDFFSRCVAAPTQCLTDFLDRAPSSSRHEKARHVPRRFCPGRKPLFARHEALGGSLCPIMLYRTLFGSVIHVVNLS